MKHYAIDANVKKYTVTFVNTKVAILNFGTTFDRKPIVTLTPSDSGTMPLYKTNITTSSMKIRCKNKWSGDVDVLVMER